MGSDPSGYAQADDIWSIGRHRALHARHAAAVAARASDGALAAWVQEHGQPLAKRRSHMPPPLMQAGLALGAGHAASASAPDTLEELAAREQAAAQALPSAAIPRRALLAAPTVAALAEMVRTTGAAGATGGGGQ